MYSSGIGFQFSPVRECGLPIGLPILANSRQCGSAGFRSAYSALLLALEGSDYCDTRKIILMALYNGEYDPYGSFSSFPSNMVVEEESLLSRYGDVTSKCFKGVRSFQKHCLAREQDFVDGSVIANEYIVFTGVSADNMMTIESAREVRGSMPKMCCLYDAREEVLIVKIMVSIGHEMGTRSFSKNFIKKLITLGLDDEIVSIGSGRVGNSHRQKEANEAFKPLSTRGAQNDWPSLATEVGFAQSLRQLQLDASFWLTKSDEKTKIVILIHIDKVGRRMQLERWEGIPSARAHRPNVTRPPTPVCVQTISLQEGVPYNGASLVLPVANFFDAVPQNIAPGAFDITLLELQTWNDLYRQMV